MLPTIRKLLFGILISVLLFSLVGCAQATPEPEAVLVAEVTASPASVTPTAQPIATPLPPTEQPAATAVPPTIVTKPTEAPTPEAVGVSAVDGLPAEPQVVQFAAIDGELREAVFFPAARQGAPVVVLMHWARGNGCDWAAIAPWLQNRGLEWTCEAPNEGPWLQPEWFPVLEGGASYNVLLFSFRGCEEGDCSSFDPEGWLADAQGVMLAATELEGVDPERIVAVGASIGADGAADGCAYLNEQSTGSCQGAFSLSPGSYLGPDYADIVAELDQAGYPARCLYAPEDEQATESCQAAAGELYVTHEFVGGGHGMMLVQPDRDPQPLQLLLDFLADTVG